MSCICYLQLDELYIEIILMIDIMMFLFIFFMVMMFKMIDVSGFKINVL